MDSFGVLFAEITVGWKSDGWDADRRIPRWAFREVMMGVDDW